MSTPLHVAMPTADVLRELAAAEGVCTRPLLHRVTDTMTGEVHRIPVPCGATLVSKCPPCAERNRKLRMQQCREGWHLAEDPADRDPADTHDNDDEHQTDDTGADSDDDGGSDRPKRSTRRRQDVPDLPRMPVAKHTVGRVYESPDGKVFRPSTFLTVTMPSYGKVNADGSPVDPDSYDYRRAALDAMHMPKLFDRLIQNLRRCAGFSVQYFAAVEPQKRLAPHVHAAIRGTIPRKILKQVVAATYHQLWWPAHDEPVYTGNHLPAWDANRGAFVDPDNGAPLPTWDDALDEIDADLSIGPAHVTRFGGQVDIQGLIADTPDCDRRIGYLAKYLGKSIAEGIADDPTPAQVAHIDRLYAEVRWLPCCPECPNWLRYGIQPKDAGPAMAPGHCDRKAHDRETLGCGGRRVLVSRKWTGKTLDGHRADRRETVRQTLAAIGVVMHDGYSATETRPDGIPRYEWERLERDDPDQRSYAAVIAQALAERQRWKAEYRRAQEVIAANSANAGTDSGVAA